MKKEKPGRAERAAIAGLTTFALEQNLRRDI